MKKIATLIALSITLVGCSSSTAKMEKPPKHMGRVKFVSYDSTPRQMSPSVEVFDGPPTRKYKVIAMITCEGAYHEEVVMTRAIIFKARQLGADGVIRITEASTQTGGGTMYGFHKGGRSLFRANAIVFVKE